MLARMPSRDDFRERVREATSIVEVIEAQVPLRPAGPGRFTGLCPFHDETAPSFQVNAERGFFHCFGCKESGDVFGFLMKREGLSFVEALHQLARRAGIPIPERNPERASRDERLRQANRRALAFYQQALAGPAGARARAYLEARGLGESTITRHGLGFAPATRDGLLRALERGGVKRAVLFEAGLVRESGRGEARDFFRDRLIFPILDGQGRAAGFAGRTLDGSEPKYMNSPDSPIYRKRSMLYGFHHARAAIRRERSALLFEGYFDCLSAWQHGIATAVAVCGTALTPDHAKLLARQAQEVVLAFDADRAGRRATRASLPILLEAKLAVRVLPLPAGRDPDEMIRSDGGTAFREAATRAPGFVDFLTSEALAATDERDGRGRAAAAREVLEVIARAPRALDREEWAARVAGALGFSLEVAREELAELRGRAGGATRTRTSAATDTGRATVPAEAARPTPAERDLIRWAAERPAAAASALRDAAAADLEGLPTSSVLLEMKRTADAGADSFDGQLGDIVPETPEGRLLIPILMEAVPLNENGPGPRAAVAALRLGRLRREQLRVRASVRRGEGGDDDLERLQALSEEIDRLQHEAD